jgi:DNA-binding MarR family transcriptional regulator
MTRVLAAELGNAGCVSLPTYEVLSGIDRASGDVRLIDLLPVVPMSQPGLSRRVDRLCAEGLVRREPDPRDGRASLLRLTDAGREALAAARPVHAQAVRAQLSRARDHDVLIALQRAGCSATG